MQQSSAFLPRAKTAKKTVEFFTAGFGYDGEWGNQLVDYPDSAQKQTALVLLR